MMTLNMRIPNALAGMGRRGLLTLPIFLALAFPAAAQRVSVDSGSVTRAVTALKAGQYVWAPEVAPAGPMLLVVNVETQRAVLFRNGVPIAASTISTGRPGHATPTGVFTILQKQVEHYSSIYDNAPMPYMQRLTWRGVALHAGNLPGYPASHGCIRLPAGFAKLLYGETKVGMTVVVSRQPAIPRVSPTPTVVVQSSGEAALRSGFLWDPAKAPEGPVSILVSAPDRRAIVIRNGTVIGSAPVSIEGSVTGTVVYSLKSIAQDGQHWVRLALSAEPGTGAEVERSEWSRFHAADDFKRAVAPIIVPGTTIIVTSDSVQTKNSPEALTVLEAPRQ